MADDASKTGIGAVIIHRFTNGAIKVVSHASRSLNEAEQNNSLIKKEPFALVFACTKFHQTDH